MRRGSANVNEGRTYMKITNVILLVILCSDVSAVTLEGKVVSVHDGDTITILGASRRQHRIRLAEIDAPGISQAFGNQSKKSLSDIVFGKSVKVVQDDVDRYRRVVGRVYVNGIDVSAEQVSRGMTWVYRKYATDKGLYVLRIPRKHRAEEAYSQPRNRADCYLFYLHQRSMRCSCVAVTPIYVAISEKAAIV